MFNEVGVCVNEVLPIILVTELLVKARFDGMQVVYVTSMLFI